MAYGTGSTVGVQGVVLCEESGISIATVNDTKMLVDISVAFTITPCSVLAALPVAYSRARGGGNKLAARTGIEKEAAACQVPHRKLRRSLTDSGSVCAHSC